MILDRIIKENDIKKLSTSELDILKEEIREFLINSISETGGHLASNLGVIELTMALHLTFDLPKDKIIWDVGHQSYTHKILTGRKDGFSNLRKYKGMSGFPKTSESECDCFNTGHSSTSISAGLGMVKAREITKEDYSVVSVIGDGALTGGLAFEALNNASSVNSNFIIVLNDNNMSISENVGGMNLYLSNFRTGETYRDIKSGVLNRLNSIPVYGEKMVRTIRSAKSGIKQLFVPGMFFEEMGIMYLGPVDGTNISEMRKLFQEAKRVDGPVLVHVLTDKGAGYAPAEKHPSRFHGTDPFEIENGIPKNKRLKAHYTDIFSTVIKKLGERNDRIVAITAAMEDGTGLRRFHNVLPDRFIDVGIAEQHAVTFAAGLASSGLIPVFAVYSSFLQRAYDQILHDVCIQNLHVIFAIDRAGIVGSDGETHQGIFDISFLSSIPNMTILAPKNKWELSDMLKFATSFNGPIAIRYPKGEAYDGFKEQRQTIVLGESELLVSGKKVSLFALGSMVQTSEQVLELLKKHDIDASLYNARFAMPYDADAIDAICQKDELIVTLEENVKTGGFGEHINQYITEKGYGIKVLNISLPDQYIEHGSISQLKEKMEIDANSIVRKILECL